MQLRIFSILTTFLALAVCPAGATDSHDYAKDEYAIIRDGLAPNKQMSLASMAPTRTAWVNFMSG